MSRRSISHLSDDITQLTNTTGVTSPILELDPTDGTLVRLLNMVYGGEGIPIYFDLRDSNDNPLPDDTTFILRVDRPTDDEPVAVSVAEDNIAAWNKKTVAEQQNEENRDAFRVELKAERVNVRYKDTLRFEVDASAQVDWGNSELYVERAGIRELAFDG